MLAGGITIKTNYANGKIVDDKLLEGLDKRGWADKIDKLMQQIKTGRSALACDLWMAYIGAVVTGW